MSVKIKALLVSIFVLLWTFVTTTSIFANNWQLLGEYFKWHKYCYSGKVNFDSELVDGKLRLKATCLRNNNTISWQRNCLGHLFTRTSSLDNNLNIVTCYEEPSVKSQPSWQQAYVRDWESTCNTTLSTRMLATDSFDATCLSSNMGWTRLCPGEIMIDKDEVVSRNGDTITRSICFQVRE